MPVPRYKTMIFGDDYLAIVYDEKPKYKYHTGVWMKPYLIVPVWKDIVEAYPDFLKRPNSLPISTPLGNGRWVEYPTYWVKDKNTSKSNAVARIMCTVEGEPTEYCEDIKEYTNQIDEIMRENDMLQRSNYYYFKLLKEFMGTDFRATAKFLRENFDILSQGGMTHGPSAGPPEAGE